MISLTLTIGNKKQRVTAKTVKDAVYKLKAPKTITMNGNLRMYNGSKFVYQFPMTTIRLRRLFSVKYSFKDIFINSISKFLE